MKRAYFCSGTDDDYGGIAVVASSSNEARRIAWRKAGGDLGACDSYFDVRARWVKDAKIEDLEIGTVINDGIDGLRRGVFGWTEDECPICKDGKIWKHLILENGVVCCYDCVDNVIRDAREKIPTM